MKKILLLSAYNTPSHDYWANGLIQQLPDYNWTLCSLPPRYFAWRIRGNSLTWAKGDYPELNDHYDLIIATSMVDITALRGFRANLATTPLIVYFHENQFDYPISEHQSEDVHIKLLSLYNAACADKILFNSQYNLTTFIKGARQLLKKLPDHKPDKLIEQIEQNSAVVPVPLTGKANPSKTILAHSPLTILWNHRWEYDKNPDVFFLALRLLKQQAVPFHLNIIGQSFRQSPAIFASAQQEFKREINRWGFQPPEQYRASLSECDLVISTSLHDFQGLAVQEAIREGCIPICPDRVAYPEYIPTSLQYTGVADNQQLEAENLANFVKNIYLNGYKQNNLLLKNYYWSDLRAVYRQQIEQIINTE